MRQPGIGYPSGEADHIVQYMCLSVHCLGVTACLYIVPQGLSKGRCVQEALYGRIHIGQSALLQSLQL